VNGYHGATAVAAAGCTPLSKRSGRSVLDLATAACRDALDQAGLDPREIDGISTFSMYGDSVPPESVAAALGVSELSYVIDYQSGGTMPAFLIMNAAMAVQAGLARAVLVFRALNGRSGTRVGRASGGSTAEAYRRSIGYNAWPQVMAMLARRYMIETGATEEHLAAVPIAQREFATANDRAIHRTPLTLDEYFASPYVAAPYRRPDCTSEVDGAHAVVVTSLERARDLRLRPAVISGSAWVTSGYDLDGGGLHLYPDLSRNFTSHLAGRLWASAGVGPRDVDVAEIYDCFSGTALMSLEGLGFCGRGEAGDFVRDGNTRLTGLLPMNTHGGLLSEGYVHGMNTVSEAVWQIQGNCGARQVPGAAVAVVTSGGSNAGSALVLTGA
jgi:acetyl-CoA acetyltransferase